MKGRREAKGSFIVGITVLTLMGTSCQSFSTSISQGIPNTAGKAIQSHAAVPRVDRRFSFSTAILYYSSSDDGDGNDDKNSKRMSREAIIARNNARCCCKAFLTQRSIQSFMFLMAECRDPHSGKWIEDFLGLQNLSQYHGTGAFDIDRFPSWEMVLLEMMEQPKDRIIVSAKRRGRGHGGWSKNNPHLEERWVEYPIDIHPASLVQRILSVRGQISNEFIQDLDIVISTNNQILNSYFEHVKSNQLNPPSASSAEQRQQQQQQQQQQQSPQELASSFERITANVLSSNMESSVVESSPFRKGNFDLLYNLCTQASIHELLRELQDVGSHREVSFTWLRDFYTTRVEEFFDGDLSYGRADDFIEEMLLTAPSVRDLGMNREGKAVIGLIDPLGLAEEIIARRTVIADKWKTMMSETTSDHLKLQKVLMDVMMGNHKSAQQ